MPAVAVVTALAPRPDNRLAEIHAALDAAARDWEWVVQVDGPAGADPGIPVVVADDPRVRVSANGEQLGAALTRNRALARVDAPLLLNADSDDVPVPGALDRLAAALDEVPDAGLAFGDWVEHWPDGGRWTPDLRFTAGRVAPGTIAGIWLEEGWMPMHLAGALWRTEAVLAAGGWMAVTGAADVGLLLAVDAGWASVYVPGATFAYHHHGAQSTAAARWHELFDLDRRLLERRARALGHGDPATAGRRPR